MKDTIHYFILRVSKAFQDILFNNCLCQITKLEHLSPEKDTLVLSFEILTSRFPIRYMIDIWYINVYVPTYYE